MFAVSSQEKLICMYLFYIVYLYSSTCPPEYVQTMLIMLSAHIQHCQNRHYSLLCNDNGEDEQQERQLLQPVTCCTSSPPSSLALNRTRVPNVSPLFS